MKDELKVANKSIYYQKLSAVDGTREVCYYIYIFINKVVM